MRKERLEWVQKNIIYVLYVAMALKVIGDLVPVLAIVSAVLVTLFFVVELFVLDFKQLVIISVMVGVLFYLLPAMVGLILGMVVGSLIVQIVAGAICFVLSSVTFTFVSGVLISVEAVSVTAPMAIAAAMSAAVATTAVTVGAGVQTAVQSIGDATVRLKRRFAAALLCNLAVFLAVCWPVLSYTMTITGALACKPAVILNQAHFHHLNLKASDAYEALFEDGDQWVFGNQFYSETVRGIGNNITQGKRDLIAGDDSMLAVLLNGVVHVFNDEMTVKIATSAYIPRRTDAMLIANGKVFLFGKNKIFVCGAQGEYTWKDTRYTTDFTRLSWEEQCERVYDILERQNTGDDVRFSYDDVGVVVYAQRNGLLLNYNRLTHTALFVRENRDGSVTVYEQTAPANRKECTSFTPNATDRSKPWVAAGADGILYAADGSIRFLAQNEGWAQYTAFEDPDNNTVRSVHYGWIGESADVYSVYVNDGKLWVDTRNVGVNAVTPITLNDRAAVNGFAGNWFYSIQCKTGPLARLTYLYDVKHDDTVVTVWTDAFNLQRVQLDPAVLNP